MKIAVLMFLVLYAVERLLETFWKREKVAGEIQIPYSLPLIIAVYVSLYLVVFYGCFRLDEQSFRRPIVMTGTILVITSVIGRNWAIKTLGVFHSIHIEIRNKHDLIQSGPYQYVRNPYYLSNIIEAIGLALMVGSRLALYISVLVYVPVLVHRMLLEEKSLSQKFGASFVKYEQQVPRIIPRLFHAKERSEF